MIKMDKKRKVAFWTSIVMIMILSVVLLKLNGF
jgi:hypothetical protein